MRIRHAPIRPARQADALEEVVRALVQALEDAKIKVPPIARQWARRRAADKKADNNREREV